MTRAGRQFLVPPGARFEAPPTTRRHTQRLPDFFFAFLTVFFAFLGVVIAFLLLLLGLPEDRLAAVRSALAAMQAAERPVATVKLRSAGRSSILPVRPLA